MHVIHSLCFTFFSVHVYNQRDNRRKNAHNNECDELSQTTIVNTNAIFDLNLNLN